MSVGKLGRSHVGIALSEALALGDSETVRALRKPACEELDPDFARRKCRTCAGRIMYVRRSRRARAHWQHVGDGLGQYAAWKR